MNLFNIAFVLSLFSIACAQNIDNYDATLVDIHSCKGTFSFDSSNNKKITANYAVRELEVDVKSHQLKSISYHLARNARTEYKTDFMNYGPVTGNNVPFTFNIAQGNSKIYRTSGNANYKENEYAKKSIEVLDTVNSTYHLFYPTLQNNQPAALEVLKQYFDNAKERKKKGEGVSNLKATFKYQDEEKWQEYSEDVFNLSTQQKGEIGESVLDLLMLHFGWKRLNAKCGSNNGIDGLYEKDGIYIAAEVKLHKDQPSLASILRVHLKPKFDGSKSAEGAITKINNEVKQKIVEAYSENNLYLLAFSFYSNGKFYSQLEKAKDLGLKDLIPKTQKTFFETLEEVKKEPSIEAMSLLLDQMRKDIKLNKDDFKKLVLGALNEENKG